MALSIYRLHWTHWGHRVFAWTNFVRRAVIGAMGIAASGVARADSVSPPPMVPLPAEWTFASGGLVVTPDFACAVTRHDDARLRAAIERLFHCWAARSGLTFGSISASNGAAATLIVECGGPGPEWPTLGEDESYTLDVRNNHAILRAATVVGALRGLATLQQLLTADGAGWHLPALQIRDRPRFLWRGLLIDVSRHWQPVEVIQRELDGMALVKLNVLHLHLTDDQGFRVESLRFPRLQTLGSDGHYFTQEQVRRIVAYAAARGIRVVPEFDMPGHTTGWLVGHPEFAAAPGPYVIERRWGVFDPVMDPTNEAIYPFLDGFLGEMAALFPDAYLHIGGDEVNGKQWNANPRIQQFIRDHGLNNNDGLQAYFNRHLLEILSRHGKKMIGWDEILNPALPTDAVIQSWRGIESLAQAARRHYRGVLSSGYYLDHILPAAAHYRVDPLPVDTSLTTAEQACVLGGEAAMWAEWVTPETIDSRLWPRAAAIAERLWSPRTVSDEDDLYRRLTVVSSRLTEAGLRHDANLGLLLRKFAGDTASPAELRALRTVIDVIEPVKAYRRGEFQPEVTQLVPLTFLADCARPDSLVARDFARLTEQFLFGPAASARATGMKLDARLTTWGIAAREIAEQKAPDSPSIREIRPLLQGVAETCSLGSEALHAVIDHKPCSADWRRDRLAALARASAPRSAVEIVIAAPVRLLICAAAAGSERTTMTPAGWRESVEKAAAPPPEAAP